MAAAPRNHHVSFFSAATQQFSDFGLVCPPRDARQCAAWSETGFACDDSRDTCVLFGGNSGTTQQDCWELAPPTPASYRQPGSGCAGSAGIPRIRRDGSLPWIGFTFVMQLVDAPGPAGVALFTFGLDNTFWNGLPLPFDLAAFGMPGCQLRVDALSTQFVLTQSGAATWTLPLPNWPALLGMPFYNQALVMDPLTGNAFGAVVSNAMRGVIGLQ